MKAVRWYGPRDMRLEEVPRPVPEAHEALVRIKSTGVCGSDMHYYTDGRIGESRITEPTILGHEYAGVVEDVGAESDRSLVGKLVAVEPGIPCLKCEHCLKGHYNVCTRMSFPGGPGHDGALCEYKAVHSAFCFPVPDNVSAAEAALIEPLSVAIHTVELARLRPGETGAILGLGPIGLLTVQVARFAGIGTLFGTDCQDYRVEEGLKYGLDHAFNASKQDTIETIMDLTNGRGVDVAFDCARSSETQSLACHIARPAGRVVLTGISGNEYDPFPVCVARRKELLIQWCRRFRYNYPTAVQLVSEGKLDVKSLITHSFPLEQTQQAFELVENMRDNVLKVSVDQ
jgi:L-iditol 2-dehydrogenase